MRLDALQAYIVYQPTALVIEDGDERVLIRACGGTAEAYTKALNQLQEAAQELREEVAPDENFRVTAA